MRWLTQNSAGIHDAQRVKRAFDGAHGSEFGRVAEAFKVDAPKTKGLVEQLTKLGANDVLIVTGELDQNLFLSARNLPHVAVCDVEALNPVTLLRHQKVVITADAVKKLEAWLQ